MMTPKEMREHANVISKEIQDLYRTRKKKVVAEINLLRPSLWFMAAEIADRMDQQVKEMASISNRSAKLATNSTKLVTSSTKALGVIQGYSKSTAAMSCMLDAVLGRLDEIIRRLAPKVTVHPEAEEQSEAAAPYASPVFPPRSPTLDGLGEHAPKAKVCRGPQDPADPKKGEPDLAMARLLIEYAVVALAKIEGVPRSVLNQLHQARHVLNPMDER